MQSKEYERILQIAYERDVNLTEDVVRKMMPEDLRAPKNANYIKKLAEVLKK